VSGLEQRLRPTSPFGSPSRLLIPFVSIWIGFGWIPVVSRLLPLLARLLPVLHTQLVQKGSSELPFPSLRSLVSSKKLIFQPSSFWSIESDDVLQTTLTELSAVLNVVQGLSLLHGGSRDLVAKRSSMEVSFPCFSLFSSSPFFLLLAP